MKPSLILVAVNVTVPSALFTTNLSNDCLVCAAHIQVQFGRTSNWHALSTGLCQARHHIYMADIGAGSGRSLALDLLCPTDRSLYH